MQPMLQDESPLGTCMMRVCESVLHDESLMHVNKAGGFARCMVMMKQVIFRGGSRRDRYGGSAEY